MTETFDDKSYIFTDTDEQDHFKKLNNENELSVKADDNSEIQNETLDDRQHSDVFHKDLYVCNGTSGQDRIKKFKCTHCEFQTSHKMSLKRHIQAVHEGVKFQCNFCDYQASQKSHLKQHIQSVHEGSKFICTCGDQFSYKSSLQKHRETFCKDIQHVHEGVKFECNFCDFQTSHKWSLKIHIESVHEGVKFQCNFCDYQASHKSNLKRHIQTAHEGFKFVCSSCGDQFSSKSSLHRHHKSFCKNTQHVHEGISKSVTNL